MQNFTNVDIHTVELIQRSFRNLCLLKAFSIHGHPLWRSWKYLTSQMAQCSVNKILAFFKFCSCYKRIGPHVKYPPIIISRIILLNGVHLNPPTGSAMKTISFRKGMNFCIFPDQLPLISLALQDGADPFNQFLHNFPPLPKCVFRPLVSFIQIAEQ